VDHRTLRSGTTLCSAIGELRTARPSLPSESVGRPLLIFQIAHAKSERSSPNAWKTSGSGAWMDVSVGNERG